MGRGRAKAKQTKVARELKYFTPDTDLSALQRELNARRAAGDPTYPQESDYSDYVDEVDDADEGAPVEADEEPDDDERPSDGLEDYEAWAKGR